MKYKVLTTDPKYPERDFDTYLEALQYRCDVRDGYHAEVYEAKGDFRSRHDFIDVPDEPDMVNHPPHYTRGKIETIDGLESAVEGLEGKEAGLTWNVIKYMWRWKFKGNPLQDLRKAEFYLKRLINHLEVEG